MIRSVLYFLLTWVIGKLITSSVWTTPATYTAGELMTAAKLNLIRDNLNALKAPPNAQYENWNLGSSLLLGSTFADVDATNLNLSITTTGGDVRIDCTMAIEAASGGSGNDLFFDILIDGTTRVGHNTNGMVQMDLAVAPGAVCFSYNKTGLSAGVHSFKLQSRETTAIASLTLTGVFFAVREW